MQSVSLSFYFSTVNIKSKRKHSFLIVIFNDSIGAARAKFIAEIITTYNQIIYRKIECIID